MGHESLREVGRAVVEMHGDDRLRTVVGCVTARADVPRVQGDRGVDAVVVGAGRDGGRRDGPIDGGTEDERPERHNVDRHDGDRLGDRLVRAGLHRLDGGRHLGRDVLNTGTLRVTQRAVEVEAAEHGVPFVVRHLSSVWDHTPGE